MYKFVKKEIVVFYVSQYILVSLALFCAVLPCFVEFKSFTGAWAILGFVVLSCIVVLDMLIVERGWYRITEVRSVFFSEIISKVHKGGIDYSLSKGHCSLQEANEFEEQSRIILDWLKDLKRLSKPLMIFSRVAMCLLIAAIILEQGRSGRVRFFLIYSIAGLLIFIHMVWLSIFDINTETSFQARNDLFSSKLPPLTDDKKMNKFENLGKTQN